MSTDFDLVKERGERLVEAMRARNIKKTYAIAIEVGVSESSFSRWRNGGTISTESAIKICEVLDISLDWFLAGRGNMNQHKEQAVSDHEYELIKQLRNLPEQATLSLNQLLKVLAPDGKTALPDHCDNTENKAIGADTDYPDREKSHPPLRNGYANTDHHS